MDPDYWLKRWANDNTGFHRGDVHPALMAQAPKLLPEGGRVLVPLCGKSLDLNWLAAQGFEVVGVDLAEAALREVITRSGGVATPQPFGDGQRFELGRLTLIQGDLLTLDLAALGPFDLIWDRGAMVALNPERRGPYTQNLRAALRPGGHLLLVTCDYDQRAMPGPPHSVPNVEIDARYPDYGREQLSEEDLATPGSKWAERGVTTMTGRTNLLSAPA